MDEAKLFTQLGMQAEAMQSLASAKAHREKLERQAHEQEQSVAAAEMAAPESSVAPMASVDTPDPTKEHLCDRSGGIWLNDDAAAPVGLAMQMSSSLMWCRAAFCAGSSFEKGSP